MNLLPAIILIIIAAIAGYVLGIVDSRITNSLQNKTGDNQPNPVNNPKPETNLPGEHSVLKVTIDTALRWHIELDETRLDDVEKVSGEQRQRMINVISQLRPWIETKSALGQTLSTSSAPAAIVIEKPVEQKPSISAVKSAATTPPKIDPIRGIRTLLKNEIKAPGETKSVSLVAMIDEVLQARLQTLPQITKAVRLEEGRMGEVIVIVGTTSYPGVDSVPDPEIRDVIKSSIADWDKKR